MHGIRYTCPELILCLWRSFSALPAASDAHASCGVVAWKVTVIHPTTPGQLPRRSVEQDAGKHHRRARHPPRHLALRQWHPHRLARPTSRGSGNGVALAGAVGAPLAGAVSSGGAGEGAGAIASSSSGEDGAAGEEAGGGGAPAAGMGRRAEVQALFPALHEAAIAQLNAFEDGEQVGGAWGAWGWRVARGAGMCPCNAHHASWVTAYGSVRAAYRLHMD